MKYELRSSVKPSELVATLGEHVQPWSIIYRRMNGHKTFVGAITETGFQLVRIGHNRNSFRPTLYGIFFPDGQSTLIQVTIRHSNYYFATIIVFFLFLVYLCLHEAALPFLFDVLHNNTQEILLYFSVPVLLFWVGPIAFLLLSYILLWLFFSSEAEAAKSELAKILSPLDIEAEKSK
jgi:hypothetical protein